MSGVQKLVISIHVVSVPLQGEGGIIGHFGHFENDSQERKVVLARSPRHGKSS